MLDMNILIIILLGVAYFGGWVVTIGCYNDYQETIFSLHLVPAALLWPLWVLLWVLMALVISIIRSFKFIYKTISDEL